MLEALLLLCSAVLKIYWVTQNPLWEDVSSIPGPVVLAGVGFELWVGAELMFKRSNTWIFISILLHFIYAIISAYHTLFNLRCNCLGDLVVPSWFMLLLNLSVLVLLLKFFLTRHQGFHNSSMAWGELFELLPKFTAVLGITSAMIICFTAYGQQLAFGDVFEEVVIRPADIGSISSDTQHNASLTVSNRTSKSIKLIKGRVSCGCVTLNKLPIAIPPRSTVQINLKIYLSSDSVFPGERFKKTVLYYLDGSSNQNVVRTYVAGSITENSKPK